MNKPGSLRDHLLANVPELRHNPDRMLIFIDEGTIRSTATYGLSFEYAYTLNIILTDYAGHPDAVAIPLLAWLMVEQSELITNLDTGKSAIQFETDILANDKVDMSIRLPLTERVIVKRNADDSLTVTHAAEPQLEERLDITGLRIETPSGELIGEWGSNV